MPITFREQKGAPLTAEEVDNNFHELLDRIEQLENTGAIPEGIGEIKQQGDELIFIGQQGSELGRAVLPTLKMQPQGKWASGQNYHQNDLVSTEEAAYICLKEHTSSNFPTDRSFWQKLLDLEKPLPVENKPAIPMVTHDQLGPSVFGQLVVVMAQNGLELLLGDIDCWRRVRDMQEFVVKK